MFFGRLGFMPNAELAASRPQPGGSFIVPCHCFFAPYCVHSFEILAIPRHPFIVRKDHVMLLELDQIARVTARRKKSGFTL